MGKDRRAREILGELTERKRLGDRLLERVGRRGWDRPSVAVSERLFARFNIADPWDPQGADKKVTPIGLGPVSLRLGPDRREPAPHLKPRQPKSKKTSRARLPDVPSSSGGPKLPPGFKPPVGVPKAKTTSGYRPPTPPPRPTTEMSREFGGGSQSRKLVGALPVRPELAAKLDAAEKSGGEGAAPARPKLPRPVRPVPRPQARSRKPTIMARNPNLPVPEGGEGAGTVDRRPPMPARPERRRRGRLSMQSTPITAAPVVTEVSEPAVVAEVVAPPPAAEPPKRVAAPVTAGGLDDLFGFAAQEGRMRFGSKKKKKD